MVEGRVWVGWSCGNGSAAAAESSSKDNVTHLTLSNISCNSGNKSRISVSTSLRAWKCEVNRESLISTDVLPTHVVKSGKTRNPPSVCHFLFSSEGVGLGWGEEVQHVAKTCNCLLTTRPPNIPCSTSHPSLEPLRHLRHHSQQAESTLPPTIVSSSVSMSVLLAPSSSNQ